MCHRDTNVFQADDDQEIGDPNDSYLTILTSVGLPMSHDMIAHQSKLDPTTHNKEMTDD